MKKLLAIVVFSVLTLSACGGGGVKSEKATDGSAPVDENANLVGFLVDLSCATAQYDGDVPEDKMSVISDKYGISDEDELVASLKQLPAGDAENIKKQSVTNIKVQCNDFFVNAGVDPETFVGFLFE